MIRVHDRQVSGEQNVRERQLMMSKINEYAGNERPPSCAHCGGTGYVYLWSIAATGSRVWFCDRNTCKLFWSDAGRKVLTLTNGELTRYELQAVVSQTDQHVLQPV